MSSSPRVLVVRLVLAAVVFALGAIVVTHLPEGGSRKGRVASDGGFEFVLDGNSLIVRMTHDTPPEVRGSVAGSDVALYCQSGSNTGPGVSTDSGPIQRWPEGRPELHLQTIVDYSRLPHPVCGVRVPNGIPFAAATF